MPDGVFRRMFEREREARKRAEALLESMSLELFAAYTQLKKSSEELFAIFRGVTDGILTFDSSGIIETLNPAVERIFGYTSEQLVGQHIEMLLATHESEFPLDEFFWLNRCSEDHPKFSAQGLNAKGQIFEMELSSAEHRKQVESSTSGSFAIPNRSEAPSEKSRSVNGSKQLDS